MRQFQAFGDPKRVQASKDQEWLRNFREEPSERVITIGYIYIFNMINPLFTYGNFFNNNTNIFFWFFIVQLFLILKFLNKGNSNV